MTPKFLFPAAVMLATATAGHTATLPSIFSSFYVLGDSNSDWGNFGVNGPPPPYLEGRFSNGPVWAEYFSDQFETGDPDDIRTWNYAFGGARVTEDSNVPDLPTQISVFAADLDPNIPDPLPGTPVLGDRPLVSVWFGANDVRAVYRSYLDAVDQAAPLDAAARQFAIDQAEEQARDAAIAVGATYGATLEFIAQDPRFNDLLAFTTADGDTTPEYVSFGGAPLATQLAILFNDELKASLSAIENSGKSVYTVDVFELQAQVGANPQAFGFTNVTEPCLTNTSICANPDEYLAWDEIGHLTGAGHAALAQIAESTILAAQPAIAPVPLPASLPALGAGLLLLGALRARRK